MTWQKELSLAALLALLAVFAYGHLLEGGTTPYSKHSDLVAQHLAMKQVGYASLRAGEGLPHWKTDLMGGGPGMTHPQALFTNPLQLLFLLMEPTAAAGPTLLVHFLAMALSMQVLGAVMGLAYLARAFIAVAGLFSFKMIILGYAGWLPVLPGLVLAPLLIAAVLKLMQRPGPGGALALAIAGTLALHGGHLQVFYYTTLALGSYLAIQLVSWLRADRSAHARRLAAGCAAGALLASLCTAYLMLPILADSGLTSRVAPSYEFFQSRGAYSPEALLTFLHPETLGTPLDDSYADVELWEDVAYFGLIPLVLALLGMGGAIRGDNRFHARFFAVGFLLSIILAFDTPLLRLVYEAVPGFSFFRHPSRLLFLTTLLGIPLAAIGLEQLLAYITEHLEEPRGRLAATTVATLLILVVAAEGSYYAGRYLVMAASRDVIPQPRYAKYLAKDPSLFRVAPIGRRTLNYGWGSFLKLELVTGFDAHNYRHYERYIGLLTRGEIVPDTHVVWTDVNRIARYDLLDALNVKYVLTSRAIANAPPQLVRVMEYPDEPAFVFYQGMTTTPIHIYENRSVLPRSYFAPHVTRARDARHALELVRDSNLHETTIVEVVGDQAIAIQPPTANDATIRFVERKSDHHLLETRNRARGFAVVGEIWHPGWRARLDGEPIPIYRTNLAQMGAWIPPGEHRLALDFRPLYWPTARMLSMLGAAGLIALAWLAYKARAD